MTFRFVNITADAIDSTWTTADYQSVEARILTWWTAMRTHVTGSHTLKEVRWYSFGPALPLSDKGNEVSGQPERVHAYGTAGSNAGQPLPYQDAVTITLRTAFAKHWGRVYVPGLGVGVSVANGRLLGSTQSAIANYAYALLHGAAGDGFIPVVYSRKYRASMPVTDVIVDDIIDVQRRRRPKQAVSRVAGA